MLKALRIQNGLTQEEVAKRAKVTTPYLSQLETGARKNPSLPVLKRLARVLGVTLSELLE